LSQGTDPTSQSIDRFSIADRVVTCSLDLAYFVSGLLHQRPS
jgi:hypothetical protein